MYFIRLGRTCRCLVRTVLKKRACWKNMIGVLDGRGGHRRVGCGNGVGVRAWRGAD